MVEHAIAHVLVFFGSAARDAGFAAGREIQA